MSPDCLPRQVFHSELVHDWRPLGRPKKRYKERLKNILKLCNTPPTNYETMAADRPGWRSAVRDGVPAHEASLRETEDKTRATRHRHSDPAALASSNVTCELCGKKTRYREGLASSWWTDIIEHRWSNISEKKKKIKSWFDLLKGRKGLTFLVLWAKLKRVSYCFPSN